MLPDNSGADNRFQTGPLQDSKPATRVETGQHPGVCVSHHQQTLDLVLCDLPVDTVNETLEMELDAGMVVLTDAGRKHAKRNHPDDFDRCLPHIAAIVANPLYIGDDLKNDGIEMIGRAHVLGTYVLVAVNVTLDEKGRYQVASFYPISEGKITSRRLKGYLKGAQTPVVVSIAVKR